jgi:hypothetical protein
MTAKERNALSDHLRAMVWVGKAEVDKLAAIRRAEAEQELSRELKAEDELRRDLVRIANEAASAADAELARRCQERGIREIFRPTIHMRMSNRGDHSYSPRRVELRRLAIARIDAMAADGKYALEKWRGDKQTELLDGVLQSSEAQGFFASLPTAETLLPPLTFAQIDTLATSPGLRLVDNKGAASDTTGTG